MQREAITLATARPAYAFRPLTGAIELSAVEVIAKGGSRAHRVTALLSAALQLLDGRSATTAEVGGLACGIREWLLQQLAAVYRPGVLWLDTVCDACGMRFDFELDLATLPLGIAGPGFPLVSVETAAGPRMFEVPCGHHEHQLTSASTVADLLHLCTLDDIESPLDTADMDTIEAAMDEAGPQATDQLQTLCPICGEATIVNLDPLDFAFPDELSLLREIHLLAAAYSWHERDILAMPVQRRRQYLGLIAAGTAGMARRQ